MHGSAEPTTLLEVDAYLTPLSEHAIAVLFLQLCALLVALRCGAELSKRLGLPGVVGELGAGIVLGPTVLGHYFPEPFHALFPSDPEQVHLLELVAWIGMVLLLLFTGIETDVRLLRHLGRSAIGASIFGMLVPFLFGLELGWRLPDQLMASPAHRNLFALLIATALSVSAMPVIAKILIDLDLARRNIGVVILSAAVVQDTVGWIVLALIAGAARGGAPLRSLAWSLAGTVLFVSFAVTVLYPLLRGLLRVAADRFQSKDTDLVVIVVTMLLCAAATDAIGVHAVFGAFVAGCVIRQVPRLREETLHRIESITFALFAPIFFGLVGLKVDLWRMGSLGTFGCVLGVAVAGKLVGCTVGALFGGLRFWESLSIAVAMNARGAMELVVATVGMALGILNQRMYSIVVMVAVTTSFMTPVLLRQTMRLVRLTGEEAARLAAESSKGLFDAEKLRVLVPTSGEGSGLAAASIALCMARRSAHPVTVLNAGNSAGLFQRLSHRIRPTAQGQSMAQHLDAIRAVARELGGAPPVVRRPTGSPVVDAIKAEAQHGYDLIVIGASAHKRGAQGRKIAQLVEEAPCHVAIIDGRQGLRTFSRLLVPVDGSLVSRVSIEFAVSYAEGAGADAEVALALVAARPSGPVAAEPRGPRVAGDSQPPPPAEPSSDVAGDALGQLSPVLKTTKVRTSLVTMRGPGQRSVLALAATGGYDLLVIGAENRAIVHPLFFGIENDKLLRRAPISVALLVPRMTPVRAA